jgi:ABC-type uncharacterized transport system ATPase component
VYPVTVDTDMVGFFSACSLYNFFPTFRNASTLTAQLPAQAQSSLGTLRLRSAWLSRCAGSVIASLRADCLRGSLTGVNWAVAERKGTRRKYRTVCCRSSISHGQSCLLVAGKGLSRNCDRVVSRLGGGDRRSLHANHHRLLEALTQVVSVIFFISKA